MRLEYGVMGNARLMVLLLGLLLGVGRVGGALSFAQSPDDPLVSLPHHVSGRLAEATALPRSELADRQTVVLTLTLNRSDEADFAAFLADVHNPRSANFHHFLRPTDQAARFGPSQDAYNAVLAYLQGYDFTLVQGSDDRLTLTVSGTRSEAERAFHVSLGDYELGQRTFFANASDPSVPASLAPAILAVSGLSTFALPRPDNVVVAANAATAQGTSTLTPQPNPMALAQAYDFGGARTSAGTAATGAGQKIGLLEFDSYDPNDVKNWLALENLPASTLNQLSTKLVSGSVSASNGVGTTEVLLDVDTLMGMAPGANYVVYEAPLGTTYEQVYNAMIDDRVNVISNSWSECESDVSQATALGIDAIIATGAASGISTFNDAGDLGSGCWSASGHLVNGEPSVPADATNAITVGGTTLHVGASGAYGNEAWWNGTSNAGGFGVSCCLTGGSGLSKPSWQSPFTSASKRSLPDVVADADPGTGIEICQAVENGTGLAGGCPDTLGGHPALHGGTSMAAPEWAAGIAVLNQALGSSAASWNGAGNLATTLYASGRGFHAASAMASPNNDFAHVGLGSFDLGTLKNTLQPPPPPSNLTNHVFLPDVQN